MSTTLAKPEASQLRGFSREAVEALSRAKGEPDWVRQERLAAWELYEQTPMPSQRDEEWRRTSIRQLKLDEIAPFAAVESKVDDLVEAPEAARAGLETVETAGENPRAGLLLQHNSTVVYHRLEPDVADQGVIFTGLDEAVQEHSDLVRRYLHQAVPPRHDKFAALHAAFWSGGTFLYVPRNVQVALPLQTRVYADADSPAIFAHTLVVL